MILNAIETLWYGQTPWRFLLYPLSLIYRLTTALRHAYLTRFKQQQFDVPVIVIGNLTVGGVGKTPLVIALANELSQQGFKPAIVSRGYGATTKQFPYCVNPTDDSAVVGDEPLMMARNTKSPVIIAPKRVDAVTRAMSLGCDVVLSDDGLQHYAMGREIECVVVDGTRQFGNNLCLPAGPLREPLSRLKRVDYLICNGTQGKYTMELVPCEIIHLASNQKISMAELPQPITAIAAIGNPQRFFTTLSSLGLAFDTHVFQDHYQFSGKEKVFASGALIMTEKDAVKCQHVAHDALYYLRVKAKVSPDFLQQISDRVKQWRKDEQTN